MKALYKLREQFVKAKKKQLQTAIHSRSLSPFQSIKVNKFQREAFNDITERIIEVDNEIEAILMANKEMKESYELCNKRDRNRPRNSYIFDYKDREF